jgi:hypothetical protein
VDAVTVVDQTRDRDSADSAGGAHDTSHDQVAEELRLLLDAMAFRAEEYLRNLGRESSDTPHGPGQSAQHPSGAVCGWCPVCAAISMLRGDRPELTMRLAEQLAGFVTLLRQALAEQQGNPPPASAPADPEPESEPARQAKVQRIDVQRVNGRIARENGNGHRAEEHGC